MQINDLILFKIDNTILNKRYGKLVISSNELYHNKYHSLCVKCNCDCGKTIYTKLSSLNNLKTTSCGHCHDNIYYTINDYVSYLNVYDYKYGLYIPTLVNTNMIDYLKTYTWVIEHRIGYNNDRCEIRSQKVKYGPHYSLHRVIVSQINKQLRLPLLSDNVQVDHISGNLLNNLYYPGNDYISHYYNNLRMCTPRQNGLNKRCLGYVYKPFHNKNHPYQSYIKINDKLVSKYFSTIDDVIKFNISQLSDEDKSFYYHSPTNPRNWGWTFSNTILNAIGYNDNEYCYNDEDFDPNSVPESNIQA